MAHLRTVLAIVAALAAAGASAQMVKCVDANGVTHYTDRPPPDCKGKKLDIHGQPYLSRPTPSKERDSEQAAARSDAGGNPARARPGDDVARAEREFRTRQMEREKAEQLEAKEAALRAQRCGRLKDQFNLFSAGRVARVNEKGERIYIGDAERENQVAQIRQEMIRNGCSS